jgi:hypothetical protein
VSNFISATKGLISRRFSLIGLSFILTSIACVPRYIFKDSFDRNANVQLIALAISAGCTGLFMALTNRVPKLNKKIWISLAAVFLFTTISTFTGKNIIV